MSLLEARIAARNMLLATHDYINKVDEVASRIANHSGIPVGNQRTFWDRIQNAESEEREALFNLKAAIGAFLQTVGTQPEVPTVSSTPPAGAMKMEQQVITGYRSLVGEYVDEGKALAQLVGEYVDKLSTQTSIVDTRWVHIGRTQLQQGFMALTRSVAKPTTF